MQHKTFGSKFEGKRAGNHFPFTVFSFQAIKHLTTVDGGALQIADEQLYEKGKLIVGLGWIKNSLGWIMIFSFRVISTT